MNDNPHTITLKTDGSVAVNGRVLTAVERADMNRVKRDPGIVEPIAERRITADPLAMRTAMPDSDRLIAKPTNQKDIARANLR